MRALIAALLLAMVGPSLAAETVVTDGDTLQLDSTTYRLDGIDAPEIDQTCLDQSGDVWPCGVTARDRLNAYIGNRAVRCEDKGPDPIYKHRRIGICSIESAATTLNEWLVREGWAIKFEPYAKGRFAAEEADARENRRGLWKGCFADRATCEDGISMERDLSAAVVKLAMRTEHATSYSASTPRCRRDARSRLS
jgi:endonuclease YncB( thermonuclease family)